METIPFFSLFPVFNDRPMWREHMKCNPDFLSACENALVAACSLAIQNAETSANEKKIILAIITDDTQSFSRNFAKIVCATAAESRVVSYEALTAYAVEYLPVFLSALSAA